MAKIGLVTVLYNSDTVLPGFIKSLVTQSFSDYHVYLIDNTSNNGTDALLHKLVTQYKITNYTHIKNDKNVGVAKGNNQGIELSIKDGSAYTLLLNNDIEFDQPTLLADMISYAENNNEPIIIPKIYFYDTKKVWMAGGKFLMYKGSTIHVGEGDNDSDSYNQEAYFKYAPTCFILIRNEVFERVGLMDEKYFVYYDDTDFMFRAYKNGFKVKLLPSLHVYHKVSALTGGTESLFSIYYGTRNRVYFIGKNLTGLPYAVSMFFTVTTRFIKYLKFNKQQRKELMKGLHAGFKLLNSCTG